MKFKKLQDMCGRRVTVTAILALFYTRGLEKVVLHVMVFNTILEFSSKWVKVMLPYREGGGLPEVRVGQSDDS
jgi:hypothetical protein